MDPRDPTVPRDLRATAREVASDYPQLGWFAEGTAAGWRDVICAII